MVGQASRRFPAPKGTVQKAHRLGKENEYVNHDQYENGNVALSEVIALTSVVR